MPNGENRDWTVEYQAAQDSAQHHDSLVWTVTSIMWGAGLVLLGLVHSERLEQLAMVSLSIFGMALSIIVPILVRGLRRIKRHRYERCQELEREHGFHLHTETPPTHQWMIYRIITALFLAAWLLTLALA